MEELVSENGAAFFGSFKLEARSWSFKLEAPKLEASSIPCFPPVFLIFPVGTQPVELLMGTLEEVLIVLGITG